MPVAIVNGKILTITRGTVEAGTVLIDKGKITAVDRDLAVPDGARVIDATGRWVTPGLIDAHCHICVFGEPWVWAHDDGNEMTNPLTPQVRGIDSLNPDDPSVPDVVAAGVTTVFTGPGSGNVIGGTGVAIKLRGRTVEEMVIPGTEAMKMALGENPKKVFGDQKKMPSTRMGNAAVLREALVSAANYLEKFSQAEEEAEEKKEGSRRPKYPERDLRWEALARVLRREMKARIHAHRADDIMTAVRIAEEFGLDLVIEHATEGYRVAEQLAARGVPCTVGPLHMARFKMELEKFTLENPGILARAGVKVAIQVDESSNTRWLPVHCGMAVRHGMPEEDAFRAVTINAAEILGLGHRLGSLEAGKDADIAIWDGHPFATYTRCRTVIVDGEVLFDSDAGIRPRDPR
ncbi:MAG: amidohydrolase [bacterium]|nr:amidohydrolase [bacterium]